MALRGLAYSVRMAAYNSDGERVSGIASTITAMLWADSTTTVLSDITITEIGNTGVYIVPLTATQMEAYNLCITAVSSTAGVTFDPVYLDTDAGRIDAATSTRLATSGYTTPPTVNDIQSGLATYANLADKTALIPGLSANVNGLMSMISNGIMPRLPASGTLATVTDVTDITPTAVTIAAAVWSAETRTLTATPTYNGPTTADVAAACVDVLASTFVVPAIYGIKKQLYSIEPGKKRQQMAFLARIQRIYDDSPILPAFVENITYMCTRYDSCIHSTTPVIIAQNVAVPVSSISETIEQSQYWTADDDGCNFLFQPDQSEAFLFDTAGVYEVEFTFVLRGGGTFTVSYRASVT